MTLGEIWVVLEGEQMRRKAGLIDRIVAATRALGQAFNGSNALQGIVDDEGQPKPIGAAEAKWRLFWGAHGD